MAVFWVKMLADQGLTTLSVPWVIQLLFVAGAIALAVLSALLPTRETLRTPALMATLAG